MTELQKCLAQNIKYYRKIHHLTQEKLAELAKTSTTYIGSIEIGKKFPSLQMIERIAAVLDVPSLQLFQANSKPQIFNSLEMDSFKREVIKNISSAVEESFAKI